MRILIAEDEASIAGLVQRLFRSAGFLVSIAVDGETALDAISVELPDLLILDLMMPNLDGWEVLRQIRSNPKTEHIPIAIYTALGDPDVRTMAMEMGANDFWLKGMVTADEMISRAAELLLKTPEPA